MAWHNDGDWTGFSRAQLATWATTELINAENERVQILRQMNGNGTTPYYSGAVGSDGGNFPSYNDVRKERLDSWYSRALIPIRNTIESMVTLFRRTDGAPPVAYTNITELLTDGSYGSVWISDNQLPVNVYLQIREALEALVWPLGFIASPISSKKTIAIGFGNFNAGVAWNGTHTNPDAPIDIDSDSCPHDIRWDGVPAFIYFAEEGRKLHRVYSITMPSPALSNTILYYTISNSIIDLTLGAPKNSGTITSNRGGAHTITSWPDSGWFTENPAPEGSVPFTAFWTPVNHPWASLANIDGAHAIVGYSIAAEFTSGNLSALMTYG